MFYFQTSSVQTSGYVPIIQPSTGNGGSPVFSEYHAFIDIPANTYMMMNRANLGTFNAPFRVNFQIE